MSTNTLILLGKRIREIRVKRGLSQEKLAEASGISSRHISEMERGDSNPSYQVLEKLAGSLGITLRDFFDFEHQKSEDELRSELTQMVAELEGEKLRLVYRVMRTLVE